jgi:DinB superfamily
MSHYSSTLLLDYLHQVVENALHLVVSEWQSLPTGLLAQAPAPQKWSAAQCLAHLNAYNRYYVPAMGAAMTKKIGQAPSPTFTSSWLGNLAVKSMLTSENGQAITKMQAMKDYRPSPNVDARAVVAEFIDHQEHLLQLIEQARKVDLNQVKVGISIAQFLKLRLGDALMFVISHQCRHLLQAQRAAQAAGGPVLQFPAFERSTFMR